MFFGKYALYSQSCFETSPLVFVREKREVCFLPYLWLQKCKAHPVQRSTVGKKNTSLVKRWTGHLNWLLWETAFKDGKPKTKPKSWSAMPSHQLEGILYSLILMTQSCLHESSQSQTSSSQTTVKVPTAGEPSCSGALGRLLSLTLEKAYMFLKLLENLLTHSLLMSRGVDWI